MACGISIIHADKYARTFGSNVMSESALGTVTPFSSTTLTVKWPTSRESGKISVRSADIAIAAGSRAVQTSSVHTILPSLRPTAFIVPGS